MEAFNMLALLVAICLIFDYLSNKGGENRKIQKRDIHLSVSSSPEPEEANTEEIQHR